MVTAWPYLPSGVGPYTATRVHSFETVLSNAGARQCLPGKGNVQECTGRTEIEKIETVVLRLFWRRAAIRFGVTSPHDEHAAH